MAALNELPAGEAESAVSWPAVIAGAVAAMAISVALTAIAAGFGFAFSSPGSAPSAFTPIAGSVMIVVQVLAAAFGGYLAGRLRTKWTAVHDHEIYFRDTAHGLLVWGLTTVVGVVLVASAAAPPGPMEAPSSVALLAAGSPSTFADEPRLAPSLPPAERAHIEALAKREKDIAAQVSFFIGVGLLLSAFVACVAAAIGGLRRDEMHGAYLARAATPGGPAI